MPECGTQCWLCDVPIRYDTYKGCSHLCSYCFAQRKSTLDVAFGESEVGLQRFVEGGAHEGNKLVRLEHPFAFRRYVRPFPALRS